MQLYLSVGIGSDLARFLIDRFHAERPSISTAVPLTVQVLKHAKDYVPGCGGPSKIIVIPQQGKAGFVPAESVQKYEDSTSAFDSAIRPVMLAGPDTTVSDTEFAKHVDALAAKFKSLRDITSVAEQAEEVRRNIVIPVPTGTVTVSGEWISPAIRAGDIPADSTPSGDD